MSISFKKFSEYVTLPDEPTDEQIVEIFGLFQNNQKIDKLKAQREKLKQDTAKKVADWRAKKDDDAAAKDDDEDQPKNIQRRPVPPGYAAPRAAAAGRAAERDWVGGMATESAGKPNFEEVEFKMDKFMPDDERLMSEYHKLRDQEDHEGLFDFFKEHADYDTMRHIAGRDFDLNDFINYLIDAN